MMKKMIKYENKESSSSIFHWSLPEEILMEKILPRLPVKSLSRFKLVCKKWFSYIHHDPYFADLYFNLSLDRPRILLSFCYEGEEMFGNIMMSKRQIISVDHEGETVNFLDLPRKTVIKSCFNGLILYETCSLEINTLHVCNPTTKGTITIPQLKQLDDYDPREYKRRYEHYYGIGYDKETKEHKVLNICKRVGRKYYFECGIITLGENNSWRKLNELPPYFMNTLYDVYANDALHWRNERQSCNEDEVIVAFNFIDEKFRVITLPDHVVPRYCMEGESTYKLLWGQQGYVVIEDREKHKKNSIVDLWILEDYAKQYWIRKTFKLPLHMIEERCSPFGIMPTGEVIMRPIQTLSPLFWLYYYDVETNTSRKLKFSSAEKLCLDFPSARMHGIKGFFESIYSWKD